MSQLPSSQHKVLELSGFFFDPILKRYFLCKRENNVKTESKRLKSRAENKIPLNLNYLLNERKKKPFLLQPKNKVPFLKLLKKNISIEFILNLRSDIRNNCQDIGFFHITANDIILATNYDIYSLYITFNDKIRQPSIMIRENISNDNILSTIRNLDNNFWGYTTYGGINNRGVGKVYLSDQIIHQSVANDVLDIAIRYDSVYSIDPIPLNIIIAGYKPGLQIWANRDNSEFYKIKTITTGNFHSVCCKKNQLLVGSRTGWCSHYDIRSDKFHSKIESKSFIPPKSNIVPFSNAHDLLYVNDFHLFARTSLYTCTLWDNRFLSRALEYWYILKLHYYYHL